MAFGLANTNKFMLGTASIMIGAQTDLFNLTKAVNSVGMVKNFKLETKPSFVDLTQGVQNSLVYSVLNGHTATTTGELYEYTSKNLAYLAQLGMLTVSPAFATTVTTAAAGSVGTPVSSLTVAATTGLSVGDWFQITDPATNDNVAVRQVASLTTTSITPTQPITIPVAMTAVITRLIFIPIAGKTPPPFYSALVTGVMADNTKLTLALPKVRITGGLSVGFMTDNYGSMPLEMTIYDLVSTDPNFASFGNVPAAILPEASGT